MLLLSLRPSLQAGLGSVSDNFLVATVGAQPDAWLEVRRTGERNGRS